MTDNSKLKHDKELKIFSTIFSNYPLSDLIQRDRPDILVTPTSGSAPKFAVEITEMFQHDGDARLNHIPDYAKNIIENGEYRDKRDKKLLPKVKIKFENEEGSAFHRDGLAMFLASPEEHRQKLVETLSKKNARVADYRREAGVSEVSLVIMDYFKWYGEERYSSVNLMTPEIEALVRASDFREIYLVSSRDRSYIPLKMLVLVSELYKLTDSCSKSKQLRHITPSEATELLVHTMNLKGAAAAEVADWGKNPVAVFGMTALAIRSDDFLMFDVRDNANLVSSRRKPIFSSISPQDLSLFDNWHRGRFPYEEPSSIVMNLKITESQDQFEKFDGMTFPPIIH